MTLREVNHRYLEPGTQILMILGIVALCQPWSLFLHRYGLTMILVGLVGFMIAGKFGPEGRKPDGVFDVSDHRDGIAGGHS